MHEVIDNLFGGLKGNFNPEVPWESGWFIDSEIRVGTWDFATVSGPLYLRRNPKFGVVCRALASTRKTPQKHEKTLNFEESVDQCKYFLR